MANDSKEEQQHLFHPARKALDALRCLQGSATRQAQVSAKKKKANNMESQGKLLTTYKSKLPNQTCKKCSQGDSNPRQ